MKMEIPIKSGVAPELQPPKAEVATTPELQPPTDAVPIKDSTFASTLSLLKKIQTTILFDKVKIDDKD